MVKVEEKEEDWKKTMTTTKKKRVGIHMAALHLSMAANHSNLLNIIMSGEIKNMCNVNKRKTVWH